jgi:hypothetical protein
MGIEGCYVEIVDPQISTILVETSVSCNINNIAIEKYDTYNLEIINTDIILPSSLPDINVDKIIGLNSYISNNVNFGAIGAYPNTTLTLSTIINGIIEYFGDGFKLDEYLDTYAFDGGTPD